MNQKAEDLVFRIRQLLPEDTIGRYDLLPIFEDAKLFSDIVEYLSEPYQDKVDYVVGLESMGWILGTAIARALDTGFIAVRKSGKLPYDQQALRTVSFIDYTGQTKGFQIPRRHMNLEAKILLVDEWIETGGQMAAVISIFERCDCIGIATIGIDENQRTKAWLDDGLVTYLGTDI